MPVDANIALGIRPVEQVNMLGQMAQAMQIRQANDEYESSNALKDFYAQGGDLSKPEDQRRLMSTVGAKGADLIAKQFALQKTKEEVKKLGYDNVESEFKQSRGLLSSIDPDSPNAGAQLMAWHEANHRSPIMGSILAASGIDAASSRATLQASINRGPAGIREAIRRSSLGQADYQKELMQTERSHIAAGPANRRLDYDIANPPQHFFTGPDGTLMVAPQKGAGGARPVPMAGGSTAAPAPQISIGGGGGATPMGGGSSIMVNPAPINNLAPVNQNALITQPQPTPAPAAPTFAQVRAVPVTKDIVDPTDPSGRRMITVEVNTYKAGTGLGVDGTQAAPAGVLGVATSQIPPNYLRDPNNPQGVIPVPGSAADPNASVPSGYRRTATGFEPIPGGPADPNTKVPPNYRRTADGQGFEFIPGGPADPAVQAQQTTGKLDAKTLAIREAAYPKVTSALTSFEAKTKQFDSIITELIDNKKGLNEITGYFAGRTDLSAMTDAGRRALSLFNTITAKGGFSELQDMRNASPTGGALGNVSNQEGKQLIDSFGALSRTQSGNDLRKSLTTAKSDLENLKTRMREAYDMTYEYRAGRAPSDGGGAPSSGGVIQFGELPK